MLQHSQTSSSSVYAALVPLVFTVSQEDSCVTVPKDDCGSCPILVEVDIIRISEAEKQVRHCPYSSSTRHPQDINNGDPLE